MDWLLLGLGIISSQVSTLVVGGKDPCEGGITRVRLRKRRRGWEGNGAKYRDLREGTSQAKFKMNQGQFIFRSTCIVIHDIDALTYLILCIRTHGESTMLINKSGSERLT